MPMYGGRGLQCWFVLIEETWQPEPPPAKSCRRLAGGLGKGKRSGRVWPYVQLQPGKETVKQGCDDEPCGWRVDRDHGCCLRQPKSWGTSKELVGTSRLGKPKEEALQSVPGTPCCRMLWGLNVSTASREAQVDSRQGGPLTCAARCGTQSAVGMRCDG